MRIYLAGPVRGVAGHEAVFAVEKAKLTAAGHRVENPVEIAAGFGGKFGEAEVMARLVVRLSLCDAVKLLPGWKSSLGAQTEYAFARAVGMPVYLPHSYPPPVESKHEKPKGNVNAKHYKREEAVD